MNILWFVPSYYEQNGKRGTQFASVQQRCLNVVYAIEEKIEANNKDFNFTIIQLQENVTLRQEHVDDADIAIFSTVTANWQQLYQLLQSKNIPIIADIEYDIFANQNLLNCYAPLLDCASMVIAANEGIGLSYQNYKNLKAQTIYTALPERRFDISAPGFIASNRLELCLYGPTSR